MSKTTFYKKIVQETLFGIIELKFTKWYITLHNDTIDPAGAQASLEWFKDNSYNSSVISSWTTDVNTPNKIVNNNEIVFSAVPPLTTWTVNYYLIWGEDESKNVYPLFYRELDSVLILTEGQVLTIPLYNLSIEEV